MNEKIFKIMGTTGAGNIAIGIIVLIVGVTVGTIAIISGAKLVKGKNDIIF